MKKDWENVTLMPEFDEQGVACYRLDGGDYLTSIKLGLFIRFH